MTEVFQSVNVCKCALLFYGTQDGIDGMGPLGAN